MAAAGYTACMGGRRSRFEETLVILITFMKGLPKRFSRSGWSMFVTQNLMSVIGCGNCN